MSFIELLFIALSLSMDALAVSICKGLAVQRCKFRHMLICGLYFGVFQAVMPLVGYLLSTRFETTVQSIAPCIAFFLLFTVGINMIIHADDNVEQNTDFSFKCMMPLAVATSIDALAVGVSLTVLHVPIGFASLIIGGTTLLCCMVGVKFGSLFGKRYKSRASQFGGTVLILISVKIIWPFLSRFIFGK